MHANYLIYVDREGKMPVLSHGKRDMISHPYYIRYVNDRPVAYHGPAEIHARDVSRSKIWDYSTGTFVPISSVPHE